MGRSLSAFLAQNVEKVQAVRYAATERIQEDGKPVEWENGCITGAQDAALRNQCTKQVLVRKHQYRETFDANAYLVKLAAASTLFPDLNNGELQKSYGAVDAESLLTAMLTPGELSAYELKVQEANGFDKPMEDTVEEAKN